VASEVTGKTYEEYHLDPIADGEEVDAERHLLRWALRRLILAAFKSAGYQVNEDRFTRPLVTDTQIPSPVEQIQQNSGSRVTSTAMTARPSVDANKLHIYSAFEVNVLDFSHNFYLCLDHRLVERVALSLAAIAGQGVAMQYLPKQRVLYKNGDEWHEGRLLATTDALTRIMMDDGSEIQVPSTQASPRLSHTQIIQLAPAFGVAKDQLERALKQLALLTVTNASRVRLDAGTEFAYRAARSVFPIVTGSVKITLDARPAALKPPIFDVGVDLKEAAIALDHW